MSLGSAIVVVLNVASIGLIFALSLRAYRNSRKELIVPPQPTRPPKSRIIDLWHVGPVRYWLFEDGEHPSVDPETGETLMNGWTHKELTEVAQRPSEWL